MASGTLDLGRRQADEVVLVGAAVLKFLAFIVVLCDILVILFHDIDKVVIVLHVNARVPDDADAECVERVGDLLAAIGHISGAAVRVLKERSNVNDGHIVESVDGFFVTVARCGEHLTSDWSERAIVDYLYKIIKSANEPPYEE